MADPLNYYGILGLTENATLHQLRVAYVKRVKETHSDTAQDGGNVEELMAIRSAYECLTDEEARKQYDLHGTIKDERQFTRNEVYTSLVHSFEAVFNSVLNSPNLNVKSFDCMGQMKIKMQEAKNGFREMKNELEDKIETILILRKQIKRQGDEINLFDNYLKKELDKIKEAMSTLDKQTNLFDHMLTELLVYHSEIEMIQTWQTYTTGVGNTTSSTSQPPGTVTVFRFS